MFNRKATYVHLLTELGGITSASGRRIAYDGDDFEHRVQRNEAHPHVCFAKGDDDDDEGDDVGKKKEDDKKTEKQFSQADVDRIVKDRLKKSTKELEELRAAKTKSDETLAELSTRLEELEDAANEGKGGGDKDASKELAKLQRELKRANDQVTALTKERDEATTGLNETRDRYKRTRVESLLRDGLVASRAHKDGLADAVELMRLRGKAELDDDEKLVVTFDGVPYEDAKEAAQAFLKKHPYLAEGSSAGGDGHPRPGNGGGRLSEKQLEGMGVGSLLQAGLRDPVK